MNNQNKKLLITVIVLAFIALSSGTAGLSSIESILRESGLESELGLVKGIMSELEGLERDFVQTGSGSYVTNVIDGDTFDVEINGEKEKVRMIGIDTPELKGSECFSKEAKAELENLIESKYVQLISDSTQDNKDRYGRLLRYVKLNEKDINEEMIENGYAHEYTHQENFYINQFSYRQAEQSAMSKKIGLWGKC